jgi:ribonuclease HII
MWLVGTDEVGRGPLAGPVVAAACVLGQQQPWHAALADSKTLTAKQRASLAHRLQAESIFAIAEASVEEIDRLNIRNASLLAMHRAVSAVAQQAQGTPVQVVVDGNVLIPNLPWPQEAIIKADATVPAVSAASILAKVYRDNLMATLAQTYPQFGWASNAGYGSASHLAALQAVGPTPHHRRSFAPVAAAWAAHNPKVA